MILHFPALYTLTYQDVAGLVPGAYQGRGRGNAFLNDLTDADVLIHVVDSRCECDSSEVWMRLQAFMAKQSMK